MKVGKVEQMQKLEALRKCALCGKSGEDLGLLSANHKELGWIRICSDCWSSLYTQNDIVSGTTGSGKSSGPPCSSCSHPCC